MKKVILQCVAFVLMGFGGYAQTLYVPGGTAGIGTTSTSNVGIGFSNPSEKLMVNGNIHIPMGNSLGFGLTSDRFSYDGKNVSNYSLSWVFDSWSGSPTTYLSSYGGVKIFSAGLPRLSVFENGNVGIGVTDSKGYKLAVGGKAVAEEIVVKLQGNWPDYVFEPGYQVPTLSDLEIYIRANRHLPGIPSAADVKNNGIAVGEMNAALLKKVEELTLYMIEANKRIEALQNQVNSLSERK